MCYSLWYNAPEDGRDQHPNHVELIGVINKPLLLHLVMCISFYGVVYCKLNSVLQNNGAFFVRQPSTVRGSLSRSTSC